MNWTRKDWLDLLLMALGAFIGVAIFGFGVAPALGIEFSGDRPSSYMIAAAVGTVSGYMLRFIAARYRTA